MGRVPAEYLRERYERARQRLLESMPLMAQAGESGVNAGAMSAGEIGALESAGLSVTPWKEGAQSESSMTSFRAGVNPLGCAEYCRHHEFGRTPWSHSGPP
jgi:hypothetical protein